MAKKKSAYAKAGVDIDVMMDALARSKWRIRGTFTRDVMSEMGTFGGLFKAPGKDSVLVTSIDGVGTKLKVAAMAGTTLETDDQSDVGLCLGGLPSKAQLATCQRARSRVRSSPLSR